MGIERIEIEGFRSLKHVVWEPSNLNVLIGPNGSGKSNVLAGLSLLSSSAQNELQQTVESYGGVKLLAWGHDARELKMRVKLSGACPCPETNVMYRLSLSNRSEDVEFDILHEELYFWKGAFHNDKAQPVIARHFQEAEIFDESGSSIEPTDLAPRETLLAGQSVFVNRQAREVRDALAAWTCYVDMPVGSRADVRRSAKSRREEHVLSDGRNLVSVIHTHYQKEEQVTAAIDDAMRAAFGDDFDKLLTPPAEDTRIQLRLKWRSLGDSLSGAELSDGILRFLLLITILSQPNPPALIAIDEPETGLHPSMLPIIAEYAVEASRKTQVIFTTHSPQFLDAFRDTIPKVTVAFWEKGQTVLKNPPEDVLNHWLKSYTLGSLMSSGELEGEAE